MGQKLFDHDKTKYKLDGKHKSLDCIKCHKTKELTAKITKFQKCADCHADIHNKQFKTRDCNECHNTQNFKTLKFEHNKTKFKLLNLHDIACEKCHKNGNYINEKINCASCHLNIHHEKFKKNKDIQEKCEICHNDKNWLIVKFDHNKDTNYKREGKHQNLSCTSCHKERKFVGLASKCNDCHKDFHDKQFKLDCDACHNSQNFKQLNFDHSKNSKFTLIGEHIWQKCEICHVDGQYKYNNITCGQCHQDIHFNKYGLVCSRCHTESGWDKIAYDHGSGIESIKGAHLKINCEICHIKGKLLAGEGAQCITCHKDSHGNSFGGRCGKCHNQIEWLPSTFNHNITGFSLSGSHRFLDCDQCHKNKIYGGLPTNCYFCHQKDFVAGGC
jgi:hypothetical protein